MSVAWPPSSCSRRWVPGGPQGGRRRHVHGQAFGRNGYAVVGAAGPHHAAPAPGGDLSARPVADLSARPVAMASPAWPNGGPVTLAGGASSSREASSAATRTALGSLTTTLSSPRPRRRGRRRAPGAYGGELTAPLVAPAADHEKARAGEPAGAIGTGSPAVVLHVDHVQGADGQAERASPGRAVSRAVKCTTTSLRSTVM